jgi:hypothetical protein
MLDSVETATIIDRRRLIGLAASWALAPAVAVPARAEAWPALLRPADRPTWSPA